MANSLSHSGRGSSTLWLLGVFPAEGEEDHSDYLYAATTSVKFPAKTPGPRKVLISQLWNRSRIWECGRKRVNKMQWSDSVRLVSLPPLHETGQGCVGNSDAWRQQ